MATMNISTFKKIRILLKQRTMLLRRYSSQLEYYSPHPHAETADIQAILLRGKLEEEGVQHGTITVKSVAEEDIIGVFANPSKAHQEILIYNLES